MKFHSFPKILLIVIDIVFETGTAIPKKEKFPTPDCTPVSFEEFFEIFKENQTYLLTNRQVFADPYSLTLTIPEQWLATLRLEKYGILLLKTDPEFGVCGLFTLWENSEGLMLAHNGLIAVPEDFVENYVVGFSVHPNFSRKIYYRCREKWYVEAFHLDYDSTLEESDIFNSNFPEKCNLTMLKEKLMELPYLHKMFYVRRFRALVTLGASCIVLVILVLLQQMIACWVD